MNKLTKIVLLILALAVIGEGLYIFKPSLFSKNKEAIVQNAPVDEVELKKQALEKFYNSIVSASDNRDWEAAYEFQPKLFRAVVSKEKFLEDAKKVGAPSYFSQNTEVKAVFVDGDKGTVFRVITTCITEDCEGDNKKIDDGSREYGYVNGRWQIPDPDPSARALSVAAGVYLDFIANSKDPNEKKNFFNKYSFGIENLKYAIRSYALELDSDSSQLTYMENLLEKVKTRQNRPVVNVEQPSALPSTTKVDLDISPRRCTSNSIGSYTYTNCY